MLEHAKIQACVGREPLAQVRKLIQASTKRFAVIIIKISCDDVYCKGCI